jgi:hypothetical protein
MRHRQFAPIFLQSFQERIVMRDRELIAGIMLTAMLVLANAAAMAFDEANIQTGRANGEDPPGLAINGTRASPCRSRKLR